MSEHAIILQMDTGVLAAHEAVIERGKQTFVDVGLALLAIRDGKGYRTAGYRTFDQYCDGRWGFTPQHGHRLIAAAEFTIQRIEAHENGTRGFQPPEDDDGEDDTTRIPMSERDARRLMAQERRPAPPDPPTETEAETSARLLSYVGDPEGRVRRSRLRHAYSTAVHELRRDLLQLTVTSIVETLDASDRTAAERLIRDTRLWLDDFERALAHSNTVRLVGSEDDEARTAP